MHSFRRTAVISAWRALPALSLFLLMLLPHAASAQGSRLIQVLPPFAMIAVVYWAVEHPRRLGLKSVFLFAVLQDVITGAPLGLSALVWLSLCALAAKARKDVREQGFIVLWVFAAVALLSAQILSWLLLSFYTQMLFPLSPVLLQWCLGVLFYPALHAMFLALEKRFHRRYWFVLKAT